jgi:threonine aldolase
MRQSGILAAAVLYALDHHMDRLVEDHQNAKTIARIIDGAGDARVVPPDTNIVMIDLPPGMTSADVARRARDGGVLVSPWSGTRVRAVTHLDADRAAVTRAAEVVRGAIEAGVH